MSSDLSSMYGPSTNLFVSRKSNGEAIVIGGVASDSSRWVRILSQRAAQLLWFQLTQMLYPEKAKGATTVVTTAPIRDANMPTVTTHMSVEPLREGGGYALTGMAGEKLWHTQVSAEDIHRFWQVLNNALYPGTQPLADDPVPPAEE